MFPLLKTEYNEYSDIKWMKNVWPQVNWWTVITCGYEVWCLFFLFGGGADDLQKFKHSYLEKKQQQNKNIK